MSSLFKRVGSQLNRSRGLLLITFAVVLYAVPFLFFKGFSQGAAYIKFDGIDGESRDKDHKGWSDILSFGLNITRQTEAGKVFPKVELTSVRKRIDKATPLLMVQCASDTGMATASLEYSKDVMGNGEQQVYYKVEMTDLVISSYQLGGSSEAVGTDLIPIEAVSVDFKEIKMTYIPFDPETGEPMDPVVGVCRIGDPDAR
jgi:type VI secretion system secreted protein Hcp